MAFAGRSIQTKTVKAGRYLTRRMFADQHQRRLGSGVDHLDGFIRKICLL